MRNDIAEDIQDISNEGDILMETFRDLNWDNTPDDPRLGLVGSYEQRDIVYGSAITLRQWREELNERLDDRNHGKISCSQERHEAYQLWQRRIRYKDINTRPREIYALAPPECLYHMGW